VSRPLPDGPLMTPKEAAAKLGVSVKTIMAHVVAGRLRFINIGTMDRKVHRFTTYNLTTFIEKQKVRETPQCQSSNAPALKHTASTFKSGAVGFLAIPKPETKKTPKPSNAA
jgi:excisionase family DNA binding protein